jgi:hypothetical protein
MIAITGMPDITVTRVILTAQARWLYAAAQRRARASSNARIANLRRDAARAS